MLKMKKYRYANCTIKVSTPYRLRVIDDKSGRVWLMDTKPAIDNVRLSNMSTARIFELAEPHFDEDVTADQLRKAIEAAAATLIDDHTKNTKDVHWKIAIKCATPFFTEVTKR